MQVVGEQKGKEQSEGEQLVGEQGEEQEHDIQKKNWKRIIDYLTN